MTLLHPHHLLLPHLPLLHLLRPSRGKLGTGSRTFPIGLQIFRNSRDIAAIKLSINQSANSSIQCGESPYIASDATYLVTLCILYCLVSIRISLGDMKLGRASILRRGGLGNCASFVSYRPDSRTSDEEVLLLER